MREKGRHQALNITTCHLTRVREKERFATVHPIITSVTESSDRPYLYYDVTLRHCFFRSDAYVCGIHCSSVTCCGGQISGSRKYQLHLLLNWLIGEF